MVVDAFHHLPDQAAAIGEAARVIAPGGALVIGVRPDEPARQSPRRERARDRDGVAVPSPQTIAAAALADAGFDPRVVVDRGFGYTVVGVRERVRVGEKSGLASLAGDGDVDGVVVGADGNTNLH